MRILVVGDSHIHAIKHALHKRLNVQDARIEIEAYRYSKIKNGKEIGDLSPEKVIDQASALNRWDLVVSTIGGNQHSILSLVQHPKPFDMYMPDDPNVTYPPANHVIPYAQLWDVFERGLRGNDGARLVQLRDAASCTVLHLSPPPPKEDAAHILKHHGPYFAAAGISEKGVSPASLRLKMWQLQINVLQKLTDEWGVQLLPPPTKAIDPKGFLAPTYYADDATHGNAAYGALLIEQITSYFLSRNTLH